MQESIYFCYKWMFQIVYHVHSVTGELLLMCHFVRASEHKFIWIFYLFASRYIMIAYEKWDIIRHVQSLQKKFVIIPWLLKVPIPETNAISQSLAWLGYFYCDTSLCGMIIIDLLEEFFSCFHIQKKIVHCESNHNDIQQHLATTSV